jgi:hypothetical protein
MLQAFSFSGYGFEEGPGGGSIASTGVWRPTLWDSNRPTNPR